MNLDFEKEAKLWVINFGKLCSTYRLRDREFPFREVLGVEDARSPCKLKQKKV